MNRRQALEYRRKIEAAAEAQGDEQALQSIELFQHWSERIGVTTPVGKRVQDGGKLYECLQLHTPQADWHPADTPALWKEVSIEEWPEWVQPTGAQDAYNTGDQVSHNDQHWVSDVDANVWEPGVYGWREA